MSSPIRILMNDPTLIAMDLASTGTTITARSHGKMMAGQGPDSRSSLSIAPDGRVYCLVRINNQTGFGAGYLHYLTRFTPQTGRIETLGVLAVSNPDYFDWSKLADGKPKPWTHGFHKLPDGTLTPLHAHMGLIVTRAGTLYVTLLCPFTLLQIKEVEN